MASRRKTRFDQPHHPAALVRALRECRDTVIEAKSHLTIGGPLYVAGDGVVKAIDLMAFVLTGDREYFWGIGAGATDAQRSAIAEKAARERGDKPW